MGLGAIISKGPVEARYATNVLGLFCVIPVVAKGDWRQLQEIDFLKL